MSNDTANTAIPALPFMSIFDADQRAVSSTCERQAARTTVQQVMPVERPLTESEIWELPIPALLGRAGLGIEYLEPNDIPQDIREKFLGILIEPADGEPFIAVRGGIDRSELDLVARGLVQRHLDNPAAELRDANHRVEQLHQPLAEATGATR